MAGQVQADQSLKDDAPSRERACKENQETSRGATIRHHVQHSTKLGGLMEVSGG
jgi:hypothetical protein